MRYNYILMVFLDCFEYDSLLYCFGLSSINDVMFLMDYFNDKSKHYKFNCLKLGKYSFTKKFFDKYDMIFDYKDL